MHCGLDHSKEAWSLRNTALVCLLGSRARLKQRINVILLCDPVPLLLVWDTSALNTRTSNKGFVYKLANHVANVQVLAS